VIRRLLPKRLRFGEEATVVEHLTELRHRLLIALFAIVPAFVVAFIFHEQLIEWLIRPLPDDKQLVTLGVTEPFTTAVKVSLIAAIAVVLPILLWQLWAFLAPAVDEKIQRALVVFVVFSTGLFAAGVAFTYFVVMPKAITFLTEFDEELYDVQIRASYYLSFVAVLLLAAGIAFQMPIFILALVRIGVVTSASLRRNRRYALVGLVAFAILLPTVDPVSLALELIPLLVLFELSIWLSALMERRWERSWRDSLDDWLDAEENVDGEEIEDEREQVGTRDDV
jgi:sec-independent protein translocase protein TatC